ncbi:putative sphingoid long-chain base transporter RSB1 [Eremomyces bilateralis CBS 781.70]|uniref:Sphingoid long-chain base transporter RSB1 n=1 Tax=Eremomyces bilateralis CBS 781.70 TaxID=1392243 RepID=A0A6G1GFI4_9PEZI|nr:putative sphingoid long-chain base transporter RSB1 [Eremomyces bilateralis CBS 781.70]KAF1816639.1 putative sphingoid long-chain base transporter RSB1 [Eremomyces bilateralis CBS 781.70]
MSNAFEKCLLGLDTITNNNRRDCRELCTLETCPLGYSYWGYLPSLAANSLFTALFALTVVAFVVQSVVYRSFHGFTIAMICGSLLEMIGYIGRVMAHSKPFAEDPYLLQIICLTIAPAFYAAGIYLLLKRVVLSISSAASPIPARYYPRIFIPCDVASLLLQAIGGGIAASASHSDRDPTAGNNIMIAGLAFQVFTMLMFIIFSLVFAWRVYSLMRSQGADAALEQGAGLATLRSSFKFKAFIVTLSFATLCIFTRCVYRVAELSEGWDGRLISTQRYFIGLEGAVIAAGIVALNLFHPGMCFQQGYAGMPWRSTTKVEKQEGAKEAVVMSIDGSEKGSNGVVVP